MAVSIGAQHGHLSGIDAVVNLACRSPSPGGGEGRGPEADRLRSVDPDRMSSGGPPPGGDNVAAEAGHLLVLRGELQQ